MKNLLLTAIIAALAVALIADIASAQETCRVETKVQDVNTPVPKELEDAKIIIRTKDGKEQEMSANEFKVVKRKQQFKVTKEIVTQTAPAPVEVIKEVPAKENKNLVMLGVSYDYTDLTSETSGNTIRLYSNKGPVVDLQYLRRQVWGSKFGLGLGLNTNGAPKGILGYEF